MFFKVLSKALIVVLLFSTVVMLQAQEPIGESVPYSYDSPYEFTKKFSGRTTWSETLSFPGAGWVKIHFSKFKINDSDYVEITDAYGKTIDRIYGRDVLSDEGSRFKVKRKGKKAAFWSHLVESDEITITFHRNSKKKKGWRFSIDEVAYGFGPYSEYGMSRVRSTCGGSDDKENIACTSGTKLSNSTSVGRMLYQKGSYWYNCTGSLISENNGSHFLTNEHCIDSQTVTDTLEVRFNYQYTTCSGSTLASYTTFSGDDYIESNATYDYCLLTLKNNPQSTFGTLELRNGTASVGENIYIIQHPGGRPKMISESPILDPSYADQYSNPNIEYLYNADTEGGSSGSPVFSEVDHKVVALHHTGYCPNEGVKMSLIYPLIKDDIGGGTTTVTYCTSSASNQSYEYIAGVSVGSMNKTSGSAGYSDFTSTTANLTAGATVNVSLTPGYGTSTAYTEYWKIWIDWNGDGDFDDSGEEVFSKSGKNAVTGSFTVPSGASGTTRMRVSMTYGGYPPKCGTFTYGEVEDYTVSL